MRRLETQSWLGLEVSAFLVTEDHGKVPADLANRFHGGRRGSRSHKGARILRWAEAGTEKPPLGILISSDGVIAVVLGMLPIASGQMYQRLVQACRARTAQPTEPKPRGKELKLWPESQTLPEKSPILATPRQTLDPSAHGPIGSSLRLGTE